MNKKKYTINIYQPNFLKNSNIKKEIDNQLKEHIYRNAKQSKNINEKH